MKIKTGIAVVALLIIALAIALPVSALIFGDEDIRGGGGNPAIRILKPEVNINKDGNGDDTSNSDGNGNAQDNGNAEQDNKSDASEGGQTNSGEAQTDNGEARTDSGDTHSRNREEETDSSKTQTNNADTSQEEIREIHIAEPEPKYTEIYEDETPENIGGEQQVNDKAVDDGKSTQNNKESNTQDNKPPLPDGVETTKEEIRFIIPANSAYEEGIGITGDAEVLGVIRNGESVPYRIEDGRVVIDRELIEPGKNRVVIKAKDEEGRIYEMEPWEFFGEELPNESTDDTIYAAKTESKKAGEKDLKKNVGKTIFAIIMSLFLVGAIAALAFFLIGAKGRLDGEKEAAAKAKEEVVAEETQAMETSVVESAEESEEESEDTEALPAVPVAEESESESEAEESEEEAEPLVGEGYRVCIDPGHQKAGNMDPEPIGPGAYETKPKVSYGTAGVASGLTEGELNLMVSLKLRDILEERGYEVIMTRDTQDVDISNVERAKIAANSGSDIFVRIHANGINNPSTHGALTYQPTDANPYMDAENIRESRRLSKVILDYFLENTGARDAGIISGDNMSGINWSSIPVTLVEIGFMTNPEEDLLMATEDYQKLMAEGIANGIDAYFAGES